MEDYIAVIGAVNMDVWGLADGKVIPEDSNPGTISMTPGGVGRNIARNLVRLGEKTEFVTVLAEDGFGEVLKRDLLENGISLREAVTVPDGTSSAYLYVTGEDRNLYVGVCDAHIQDFLTPEVLREKLPLLCGARAVVLDGNLTEEAIRFIIENVTAPIFADTVSETKAMKFRDNLGGLFAIKPNRQEAEALTGEKDPVRAAEALARRGCRHVFVSDGGRGMVVSSEGRTFRIPCCEAKVKNVTGAGDSVMAALVRCYVRGMNVEEAARFSMAAGSITAEAEKADAEDLSVERIFERMDQDQA